MRRFRCFEFLLVLIGVAGICVSAAADPISKVIDPSLFGHLNQHKTKCPKSGCGATAVLNSIVFLQSQYPSVYQGNLTGPDEASQIATANELADDMHTVDGQDTSWSDFVSGKEQYIDSHAPGTTSYSDESIYDGSPTIPTPTYIIAALMNNQDVEILVEGRGPKGQHFGHYVTVTGMSYDPTTFSGTFEFVDPADGMDKTRDFFVGDDGFMDFTAASGLPRHISGAVSEGPTRADTPEPASFVLAFSGMFATMAGLRARRGWPGGAGSRS